MRMRRTLKSAGRRHQVNKSILAVLLLSKQISRPEYGERVSLWVDQIRSWMSYGLGCGWCDNERTSCPIIVAAFAAGLFPFPVLYPAAWRRVGVCCGRNRWVVMVGPEFTDWVAREQFINNYRKWEKTNDPHEPSFFSWTLIVSLHHPPLPPTTCSPGVWFNRTLLAHSGRGRWLGLIPIIYSV